MTILDEMEAALKEIRILATAHIVDGLDSRILDIGNTAGRTLREYESLKGQIAVVPVQTSEAREKALNALDDLIKAGDKAFEGEVAVDGWNTDNLIVEARHQKSRFLQFASFNFPGAQPDPRANAHFVSVCFNRRDLFKQIRAALQQPDTSETFAPIPMLKEVIWEHLVEKLGRKLYAHETFIFHEIIDLMASKAAHPAVIAAMKGEDHGK